MNRFFEFLAGFGMARVIAMVAVAAGLVGFFAFITMRLNEPDMRLLYGELDMAESGRIVERLESMNVPYRLADGGRTILAPAERVSELRVGLAGQGLGGDIIGYEIFDRSEGLGTTSFVQNINRLRAIEGELSRTIREINNVEAARVHIVLPERQLFAREEREPTASIVLRTKGGGLTAGQVAGLQYMISAAVPGLNPQNISIVDQNGTLLAKSGEGLGAAGLLGSFDEKRRQLEDYYRTRIEQLLEKTVGVGRVRAQVAVALDMNAVTTNEEIYDPESQVVRSTRSVEETSRDQETGQETVSVGNNLPDAPAQAAAPGSLAQSDKFDETVNYEISRTVRTHVKERGAIERVSVAVVVDGTYVPGADGERVYQERSDAELERLASLVRSAIGYDANRGDTVEVANLPFAQPEELADQTPQPFRLFGLGKQDLYAFVEMLVFGVVSIFVIFLIVRPLVNRLIAAIPEAAPAGAPQLTGGKAPPALTDESGQQSIEGPADSRQLPAPADTAIDVAQVEGRVRESSLKKVGDIVRQHPDEAGAIVRSWLYSE